MAITTTIGGIRLDDNRISTVIPISMLLDMTISGMAFEPREKAGESYDHLDDRVKELMPARNQIQRTFFAPAMREVRKTNPETGEKYTEREPTGWSPTAKYRNATGELQKYIGGPYLDRPPLRATLPAFVIYYPEKLEGQRREDFDAHMGGEFYDYTFNTALKAMLADGESRHLAIESNTSPNSKLSGTRKEKLKSSLVTVEIIHGVPPADMGQMYADLNGKGVKLTRNEMEGLDVRDPWARATKEIFDELKVPLVTTGRQVTAVSMAEHKHLLIGHAIKMVRAMGLGSYSKANSSTGYTEVIAADKDYERLVKAGVNWFGMVLDHFKTETLPDGTRDARVFTDPDLVVRAMPIKVALGQMGNAWFEVDLPKQFDYKAALSDINWRVGPRWQGVAGKVAVKTEKKKVDGKTVKVEVEGEYTLAASGAKEIGGKAVSALTKPDTIAGKAVRGLETPEEDGSGAAA